MFHYLLLTCNYIIVITINTCDSPKFILCTSVNFCIQILRYLLYAPVYIWVHHYRFSMHLKVIYFFYQPHSRSVLHWWLYVIIVIIYFKSFPHIPYCEWHMCRGCFWPKVVIPSGISWHWKKLGQQIRMYI